MQANNSRVELYEKIDDIDMFIVCRNDSRKIVCSILESRVQVQILLTKCQRFAMVRISDNGPGCK